MDLLLALMACSFGAYLILLCDPWTRLHSRIEAGRLPGTGWPGAEELDFVRTRYPTGLTLGHWGLMLLSLPASVALKRRQDARLRASL